MSWSWTGALQMADQDASCGCTARSGKYVFIFRKHVASILLLLLFVKADNYSFASINLESITKTIDNERYGFQNEGSSHLHNSRKSILFNTKYNIIDGISSNNNIASTSKIHINNSQAESFISKYQINSETPYTTRIFSLSASSSIPSSSSSSSTIVLPSSSICISIFTVTSLCKPLSSTAFSINSAAIRNISISNSIQISPSTAMMFNISDLATTILTSLPEVNISTAFFPSTVSLVDISTNILPSVSQMSSSAILKSAYVILPASKYHKCDHVAANFSLALNNYTHCVLLNLKPMEVCFKCFKEYDAMKQHHRNIYKDCKKELISSYNHNYQVVAQLFDLQQKTWKSLQCEKCYDYATEPPKPTTAFLQFQKMHRDTIECFRNNTQLHPHNSTSNITNNVCINCQDIYSKLQLNYKFQEDGDHESETMWCADINVVVNDTRHIWSQRYHCGKKDKDLLSIIALTCFFCFLPIVFYVGAKLHADVKERKTNRYYESE